MSDWLPPATDLIVDIGDDGGALKVVWSPRKYWINDEPVTEEAAWAWIAAWHTKRDAALGADPCTCQPCVWYRGQQ
jgi:hypothetical protein